MAEWFSSLHPVLQAIIRVNLFVFPAFLILPVMIWYERRLLGWMQDRVGPNRVGTITFSHRSKFVPGFLKGKKIPLFGLLQPLADGVKSFFKEDTAPGGIDRVLYYLAPALFLFPAFALGATIPWAPYPQLTPVADVNIGVLWIMAISSLAVYGVVLAGYSSNNKYSLLGGLRSSAQLISYELAMSVALAAVVLSTGSLKPTDIVKAQNESYMGLIPALANWNILTPFGLVAGIIFLVCMIAESNRAPFDLPEAESELVAGYNTEYTTKKWVLFMMAEYMSMITWSGIIVTVFFGGYHMLPIRWQYIGEAFPPLSSLMGFFAGLDYYLAPLWFLGKIAFFLTFYIWLRATLPRLRYDQLMNFGWKIMLPIAVVNLIVVAFWILMTRLHGPWIGLAGGLVAFALLYVMYKGWMRGGAPQVALTSRTITLAKIPANVAPRSAEPEGTPGA